MNLLNDILKSYLAGFEKFNDFSGRATRLEFWSFALINGVLLYFMPGYMFLAAIIFGFYLFIKGFNGWRAFLLIFLGLIFLFNFFALPIAVWSEPGINKLSEWNILLFGLILLFPILPLWFRRMHDTGINENWLTVPLIGLFISISIWADISKPDSIAAQSVIIAIKGLSIVLAAWIVIIALLPSKKSEAQETTPKGENK